MHNAMEGRQHPFSIIIISTSVVVKNGSPCQNSWFGFLEFPIPLAANEGGFKSMLMAVHKYAKLALWLA